MGLGYRAFIKPCLFRLQPETAHHLTIAAMRNCMDNPLGRGYLRALYQRRFPSLAQELWGRQFVNPVGLAAGLDKNAEVIAPFAAVGFSHVEVGTLTGQAQPGNDRPRLFRLPPDQAVINRMGFNNRGAADAAKRLRSRYDEAGGQRRPPCILGINIGKSKVVPVEQALDDYRISVNELARLADYLVVNVSSPNTPGLRDLQAADSLRPLVAGVRAAVDETASGLPLLVKIAPDLHDDDIDAAVDVALEAGADGLIATNTTISRDGLQTGAERIEAIGAGGLSGAPLRQRATAVLARVAKRVAGRIPIIGVGGIDGPDVAWEKICHGASLVQVYSALIYHGPALVSAINRGLAQRLQEAGLSSISEAVGRDL